MSSSADDTKPVLNQHIQILIGEQIGRGICGRHLNEKTFNLFVAGLTVRNAALASLRKMRIFVLNEGEARICSADEKHSIIVDFKSLVGYVYLKHLVKLMVEYAGNFFTEVYLISLRGMEVAKLFDILLLLNDLTVLNLPYEFDSFGRNGNDKKLHKLIQKNARTLQSLHHLIHPISLPNEIRQKVIAINCATLRTGTLERECDFFAFYTDKVQLPSDLVAPGKGVIMRICIHRYKELLRAIKRTLQRDKLRSEITTLNLCSVYDFDTKSSEQLLAQIERFPSVLPKLNSLSLEMRTQDSYPDTHYYAIYHDEPPWVNNTDLVPSAAANCSHVANLVFDWLGRQKFEFAVNLNIRLLVDYQIGDPDKDLLERAMLLTIERSVGQKWAKMMRESVMVQGGCVSSRAKLGLNDKASVEFSIEFRSINVNVDCPRDPEKYKFRVMCTL